MPQPLNVEFLNADPRCACVLLLDTSGSMNGAPINALNQGLLAFQQSIQEDALASRRVEVAIVTFGSAGVQKIQEFVTGGDFAAPVLEAGGATPMGEAIRVALEMVRERKATYRQNGVLYYQPWVVMITDGAPTDNWRQEAQSVRAEESAKALSFFAIGVGDANMQILTEISLRAPLKLDGLNFLDLFVWLSQSQKRVSANKVGEQTALPAVNWAAV
ncbi:MAG: VWA domain-containing protein [Bryobacteraceae bacterium]